MMDPLWKKVQDDDVEAFNELYHTYVNQLYNYGSRFTSRSDIIKDTIQNLFIHFYQKRHDINITTSVKAYLITSMRRSIIAALKDIHQHTDYDFSAQLEIVDPVEQNLIKNDERQELKSKLESARDTLTKRQAEAIFLKFDSGLDYDEICDIMNLTKEASYKLVNEALKRLSKNFQK